MLFADSDSCDWVVLFYFLIFFGKNVLDAVNREPCRIPEYRGKLFL